MSSAGGGRGAYAVAGRDVADRCGEEVRVLAGGEVAAGEGQDRGLGHALAGGRDLPVLVGVLVAATHVEGDPAVQLAGDRGEIPALRVAAVLGDEARGVVEERRSVSPGDRRPQLGELGRGGTGAAGVQACPDHRSGGYARRMLRPPHSPGAHPGASARSGPSPGWWLL